ncbi:hypothetical protein EGW08_000912 [Elysia chlorotica]|uniref:Death domain-containing protein n=1 Tax=Elysia chlorotica TaxID=188477 RepID=A0A3S1CFH7_ELYCH|nr:hypothetical protein EGW08_000912 [Elysia chlorotica]
MGMCKNTDQDENTSMETNTSQPRQPLSNQQGDHFVGGAQGGAGRSCLTSTSPPTEEDVIPWKFVPQAVVRRLVQKLNPENFLSGNNWKALAGALGYNSEEIRFIGSVQGVHSEVLLSEYAAKPDASLNEVLAALESIRRKDCVEIVCDALPEIRQIVQNSVSSPLMVGASSSVPGHSGFGWAGRSMFVPSMCQSGSSRMMSMTHPSASNMCCMHGHISIPCSHVSVPYGESSLSCNLLQPGVMSCSSASKFNGTPVPHQGALNKGGCCSVVGKGGNCVADAQQQWMLQQARPLQESYGELGCMQMDTAMSDNISPMHSGYNSGYYNEGDCQARKNSSLPMDCGGDPVRPKIAQQQLSDEGKPDQCHYNYDKKINNVFSQQSPGQNQHFCGGSRQVQGMLTNTTLISQPSDICGSHSSEPHSSFPNHHSTFGATCGGKTEPVGMPRKTYLPSLSGSSVRDHKPVLGQYSGFSQRTGNTATGSSSMFEGQQAGGVILGHRSEGSGPFLSQGRNNQVSPDDQGLAWATPGQNLCVGRAKDGWAAAPENHASLNACSPQSQGLVARQGEGTSLSSLEKMEAMRDKYKPSSTYQTIVAEQKIEPDNPKITKDNKPLLKKKNSMGTGDGCSALSSINSNTSEDLSTSSTVCSASQTFPMRIKVRHEREVGAGQGAGAGIAVPGVEGSLNFSKKSVSMPQNMKPQPYRKAWRGIKVFVTYSMDSPRHNEQVLCLGYFLKNNGFNCYLDTPFKQGRSAVAWQEHVTKFQHKFYEVFTLLMLYVV